MLGSVSGTAPGIPVDGLVLPLALDAYTLHTLAQPNHPPLLGGFGVLAASSPSTALFAPPPGLDPGLAGLVVHHAYAVLDPFAGSVVHASNAIATVLVP